MGECELRRLSSRTRSFLVFALLAHWLVQLWCMLTVLDCSGAAGQRCSSLSSAKVMNQSNSNH